MRPGAASSKGQRRRLLLWRGALSRLAAVASLWSFLGDASSPVQTVAAAAVVAAVGSVDSVSELTSSSSSSESPPPRQTASSTLSSVSSSSDPCRGSSSLPRVCDPDQVLSEEERLQVQQAIDELDGLQIPCQGQLVDVQMAVALVHQVRPCRSQATSIMGQRSIWGEIRFFSETSRRLFPPAQIFLDDFFQMDGTQWSDSASATAAVDAPAVAELLARSIHDQWGVGYDGPCGGTGVVLFASIVDRSLYVSRGQALESVLTDARLDTVLESMKPLLRQGQYGPALILGVQAMRQYVQIKEQPSLWEVVTDEHSWILWVILGGAFLVWRDRRRRRQYAAATAQLNELDRARAEALQGRFQATSCPICLEPFRMDKTSPCSEVVDATTTALPGGLQQQSPPPPPPLPRFGSDGRPLRLLRCGHMFDESCWEDWLKTTSGRLDRCCICLAPLDAVVENPAGQDADSSVVAEGARGGGGGAAIFEFFPRDDNAAMHVAQPNDDDDDDDNNNNNNNNLVPLELEAVLRQGPEAVVRRDQQERAFRLQRLHRQYPEVRTALEWWPLARVSTAMQFLFWHTYTAFKTTYPVFTYFTFHTHPAQFIGPRDVRRWSEARHDEALANDSEFVRRDPSRAVAVTLKESLDGRDNNSIAGSLGFGAGLGGGTSAGGRGGQW